VFVRTCVLRTCVCMCVRFPLRTSHRMYPLLYAVVQPFCRISAHSLAQRNQTRVGHAWRASSFTHLVSVLVSFRVCCCFSVYGEQGIHVIGDADELPMFLNRLVHPPPPLSLSPSVCMCVCLIASLIHRVNEEAVGKTPSRSVLLTPILGTVCSSALCIRFVVSQ
jgi:hypothetical protein